MARSSLQAIANDSHTELQLPFTLATVQMTHAQIFTCTLLGESWITYKFARVTTPHPHHIQGKNECAGYAVCGQGNYVLGGAPGPLLYREVEEGAVV